jgi:hypothetical protein
MTKRYEPPRLYQTLNAFYKAALWLLDWLQ